MEMELNKDVLKVQRDTRAWSQTQLAEVSGLSLRTIQRIEKTGVASLESAKSLASVYEISIKELNANHNNKPETAKSVFHQMSSTAKVIHITVLLPVLCVALYLWWTEHNAIMWVNTLRDAIFSSTISEQRLDKISFLIVVVVVGLPSLIPGFIYEFIKKQGMFAK
ncbi:helix-turn-helix transcriptional regulator [Thalassotalea psychrophila]|uniref:Helix-turn-helix transcriptional regulator n=1 Tax=Thalassotalea psychrophila TaxID=3065647 RepID=A0ABY9TUE8_9GAMM|nr:helix-turn-helix transcriptional regulator [Colwelliaceae bacterium SQ149]